MKAFALYNDYEIVGEYEDAGKSGKSIEGRVQFTRMMEDIKSGKDGVSFVLVFKLSRFARNAADVLSTLQTMQDFGVNLICVEDGIDSSKDAGKLMISVLSAVAEIERENKIKQLEAEADAALRSPTTITIATRPQVQQTDDKILLAQGNKAVQDYDGNRQESKRNFLMNEQAQKYYQSNFMIEQLSEFEIKAGDFIPAILQTGINSDLPSKTIVAIVSENVRDTIRGKHILIPQGTKIIGVYDSSITFGQERLLIIWQRLIFPNGKTIGLDNMQGVDLSGKAGITGDVNNHFSTLLKGVILSSIMGSAGAIVTERKNDWRGAAAEGAGEQIVTIGDNFAERALSRQPTITIEPGTRFNIIVHSDLILEPYGE